jgi:hybrid cluster-associated redox disulfide protein
MQDYDIHPEMPILELLSCWPQTIPVFQKHKMACVGCSMANFETISSAADIYQLHLKSFIVELNEAVQTEFVSDEDH